MATFNPHDAEYQDLLWQVLEYGEERTDRTGVGTIGLFGAMRYFDIGTTFPLLTTKKLHWKSIVHELLWIMSGSTNVNDLRQHGVTIWDEWADENGELGPVYGKQWRAWSALGGEVDQLQRLIDGLRADPYSRRHVVSAWNAGEVDKMALPPCHALFQFWVSQADNSLHCQLYQRSADVFLGLPFNIASYSLLTCILADTLGFGRGSFSWVGGDVHIYKNHLEQVNEQRARRGRAPPTLERISKNDPLEVRFEDIILTGYDPYPAIPAPVAV